MSRGKIAIANCRVSSDEQLQNHSLERQRKSVMVAADKLEVEIVKWWSGSVSSKAGTNIKRKDLQAMLDYCKHDKRVRYAIFDEYDRFMRSVNEGPYFEVLFQQLGVKVWYASESDAFNGDDAMAKFMRSMSAFKAEGSNEERQRKSISGQTNALKDGRWPFCPKPGYMKGRERGIPEIHPVRGPALRAVLIRLADGLTTPSSALVELNNSEFTKNHSLYKMDKFRKIATDPFYARVVEIDRQVKHRNEGALHEPLITYDQHITLLRVMDGKSKTQTGPRKNGNPKYPGNTLTICDGCLDKRNGKFVGFDHSNGKANARVYESYRCRSCGKYMSRQSLHSGIEQQFKENPITEDGTNDFLEALEIVWKERETMAEQEAKHVRSKLKYIEQSKRDQVEALADPRNVSIRDEILSVIESKKAEIYELEKQLDKLETKAEIDKEQFLRFAYKFAGDMGNRFLDPNLSQENRLRCKQIMFPAGFYVDDMKKVYTPKKSPLITVLTTKKGAEAPDISHLVLLTRRIPKGILH